MILYNKIQKECIEHPPSPLMIIAGAGTGKTTTIVGRIANLIKVHNIEPKSILAMTYTVRAAEHLKSEISNVVGSDYDSINALNFHSFALNQIQSFYEFLGYKKSPSLIESNESKYLIRKLILDNTNNFTSSEFRKNSNSAYLSFPKIFNDLSDDLIYGDELNKKYKNLVSKTEQSEDDKQLIDALSTYFLYQKVKIDNDFIDFGDMLINLWILLTDSEKFKIITNNIDHVIVDEFQDNNFALTEIVKRLAQKTKSITVVGDDDQSIYSFRGANNDSFNSFRNHYQKVENYKEIILSSNYRSTQSILNFANETVKNINFRLKDEPLISNSNHDSNVILFSGDRNQQLNKIKLEVKSYLNKGVPASEICILTRSRSGCIEVSEFLNRHGMSNSYLSGNFFEDSIVKDFISFLNIIENGLYFDIGLYRLLSKSKKDIELNMTSIVKHCKAYLNDENFEPAYEQFTSNEVLNYIRSYTCNNDRKDIVDKFFDFHESVYKSNLDKKKYSQLVSIVEKYLTIYQPIVKLSLCSYINSLFDLNETFFESIEQNSDSIQIMTVHQSKGMEFDYVMIPFLSANTFPSSNKKSSCLESLPQEWKKGASNNIEADNYDEERRIFHVAATRARKKLLLFAPEKRRSKFFKEIQLESFFESEIENFDNSDISNQKELIHHYINNESLSFSATSLSLYDSCPLAYKYKMLDRLKVEGYSPEAAFGIFVHNIFEKIFTSSNSDHMIVKKIIDEEWDDSYFENSTQSSEYKKEADALILSYFKDNPVDETSSYILEKEFSVFMNDVEYRGKIDRIDILEDGDIQIIDYKTSNKKKTAKAIKKDIQLPYYFFLLSRSRQEDRFNSIKSAKLEYLKHPADPSVEINLSYEDILNVEKRVKNISKSVKKESFAPKKNPICYYCDYKRLLCPLYK